MTTISYTKPYGDFSSAQAVKVNKEFMKERYKAFLDGKPAYLDGFIVSDAEFADLYKRKISSNSMAFHALKLSKTNFVEVGNKSVEINTSVYIALIYHRKGAKVFFDLAPYLVTMSVEEEGEYDLISSFYPKDVDAINDAIALGAEAEVMKITSSKTLQTAIPDILYKNFYDATEVIYDICEDLFLFN